jgi:signal transduction histidine kinase
LSIAWRLARQLGGDVRFEEIPGGPTRFVLSLSRQAAAPAGQSVFHDTSVAA